MRNVLISLILCLMAAFASQAQNGDGLGRFFTTPQVRSDLNRAREQYQAIVPDAGNTTPQTVNELFVSEVKLNGVIIRGDGSSEVWVNGSNSLNNDSVGRDLKVGTQHIANGKVKVSLPKGDSINLKPGQVYSVDSNQIRESYEQPYIEPAPVIQTETEEPALEDLEGAEAEEGFDESILAQQQEEKIKLLEERIERLEQGSGDKN